MKERILSVALCMVLLFSTIAPAQVLAAEPNDMIDITDTGLYWYSYDDEPSRVPEEMVTYKAGGGTITFVPGERDEEDKLVSGTLICKDAVVNAGLDLGEDVKMTIELVGDNSIDHIWGNDLTLTGAGNLTVSGDGEQEEYSYSGILIETWDGKGKFVNNSTGKLNAIVQIDEYQKVAEHESSTEWEASYNATVYGNVNIKDRNLMLQYLDTLTIEQDAVLTIQNNSSLLWMWDGLGSKLINNGTFVNDGEVNIEYYEIGDETVSDIVRSMTLTGDGNVSVKDKDNKMYYYTNSGEKMKDYGERLEFVRTPEAGGWKEGASVEEDGYSWDAQSKVLEIKNLCSSFTVPYGTTLIVHGKNVLYRNIWVEASYEDSEVPDGFLKDTALTICGDGGLNVDTIAASQLTITGDVKVNLESFMTEKTLESFLTVSGNASLAVTKGISMEGAVNIKDNAVVDAYGGNWNGMVADPAIAAKNICILGGTLKAKSHSTALVTTGGELAIGEGIEVVKPSNGKFSSVDTESNVTVGTVVSDGDTFTFEGDDFENAIMSGKTNGAKEVVISAMDKTWLSDSAGHWRRCLNPNCDVTSEKEAHIWNVEKATEETDKHCTVCSYVAQEKLKPVPTPTSTPKPTLTPAPSDVTPKPGEKEVKPGTLFTDKKTKAVYRVTGKKTAEYVKSIAKNSKVQIPAAVKISGKTYNITGIAAKAFQNNKKLKTIIIGKNIMSIGSRAFYKCKKLAKITIQSKKLKKVGKNAIKGIKKKAVIRVPKSKLKVYRKLFKAKTGFTKPMKIRK